MTLAEDTLVIFALGDTLVAGPEDAAEGRLADALGLDEAARGALSVALTTTAFEDPAAIAAWLDRPDAADAIEDVWLAEQTAATPLPGADATLERLAAEGFTLAVLANAWEPYLAGVLDHLGDRFDASVAFRAYSFATGIRKPDPRAFTQLLEVAGVPPTHAVMVGASLEHDIAPARALGLQTVWIGQDVDGVGDVRLP